MPVTVKGVIARSKGAPVEVVDIVVPDPGPGEALVDVQACGVCHTDLHYREGGINDDFPFLLGHEAAGVVEAVGDGVTDVAPGDFVVLNWRAVCGQCRACARGEPQYCFNTHNATPEDDAGGRHASSPPRSASAPSPRRPSSPPASAPRSTRGAGCRRRAARLRRDGRLRRRDQHRRRQPRRLGRRHRLRRRRRRRDRRRRRSPAPRTIIAVDIDDRKLEWATRVRRHPHRQLPRRRPRRGDPRAHRRLRRRRGDRRGRPARDLQAGVLRPRPRRHRRPGRRPDPGHEAGTAAAGRLRPRRLAEVLLVRRLPALARLPDAGRPLQAGPAGPGRLRHRDASPSTRWRKPSTRCTHGEVLRSVVEL